MAFPKQHPLTFQYVLLKSIAVFLRGLIGPGIWLAVNYVKPHGVPGVTMRHAKVPSRERGRTIDVHIYEKEGGTGKKPVLINWHGSGFVVPGLGGDDAFCAQMADQLDCVVVDCQYRKAPEYPFPAGAEDAEDAALWVLSQGEKFDLSRVSLSGFSAGGNFALGTSWVLGPEKISSVTCFYPPTYFTISPVGKKAPGAQPLKIMSYLFKFFDKSYIIDPAQRPDPRLSVLLAPLERYPATVLLICGSDDTLHGDSSKLITKLKESGHKDAEFVNVQGKRHAFDKEHGAEAVALANKYYAQCGEAIARSWKRRESKL